VTTRCLQPVGRELRDKLKEGEAEKQKRYSAVVWAERELTPADLGTLRAVTDLVSSMQKRREKLRIVSCGRSLLTLTLTQNKSCFGGRSRAKHQRSASYRGVFFVF
jgi:hypothetical protein